MLGAADRACILWLCVQRAFDSPRLAFQGPPLDFGVSFSSLASFSKERWPFSRYSASIFIGCGARCPGPDYPLAFPPVEPDHIPKGTTLKFKRDQSGWKGASTSPRIGTDRKSRTVPELGVSQTGCPLWVKSGRDALKFRCPLYPRKRTFVHASGCPLWAKSRHSALHKERRYSITSSAQRE